MGLPQQNGIFHLERAYSRAEKESHELKAAVVTEEGSEAAI